MSAYTKVFRRKKHTVHDVLSNDFVNGNYPVSAQFSDLFPWVLDFLFWDIAFIDFQPSFFVGLYENLVLI